MFFLFLLRPPSHSSLSSSLAAWFWTYSRTIAFLAVGANAAFRTSLPAPAALPQAQNSPLLNKIPLYLFPQYIFSRRIGCFNTIELMSFFVSSMTMCSGSKIYLGKFKNLAFVLVQHCPFLLLPQLKRAQSCKQLTSTLLISCLSLLHSFSSAIPRTSYIH